MAFKRPNLESLQAGPLPADMHLERIPAIQRVPEDAFPPVNPRAASQNNPGTVGKLSMLMCRSAAGLPLWDERDYVEGIPNG